VSGSFTATWLALREPYDHVARDAGLARRLQAWLARRSPIHVVDLGAGLGSNLRWLGPRLGGVQRWRLVEDDPSLVTLGTPRCPEATYLRADLRQDLDQVLAGPLDVVTASALIDLVSGVWLERLVAGVAARRCALLLALTYDGSIELGPAHPFDGRLVELVNRHQRRDKGFGPALGPTASAVLAGLLSGVAGEIRRGASPWLLTPSDAALQSALVSGWAEAAAEIAPDEEPAIVAWRERRLAWIIEGQSSMRVGHEDLLWLPRA
jgi:hypothetical protein